MEMATHCRQSDRCLPSGPDFSIHPDMPDSMGMTRPEMNQARLSGGDWGWLLTLGVITSAICMAEARLLSATFDEPVYIRCGLEHWFTGSYKQLMRLGTMPLPADAQTLPIYLLERLRGATLDFSTSLRWARAGSLLFWWALLFYAMRSGRALGGIWGGRLAATLIASEPVLLGHAGLATTDIAVTACLLALGCEFEAHRGSRWALRVALPALLYGLSILAKASGLVFGPVCLLVIHLQRRVLRREAESISQMEDLTGFVRRDGLQIVAIGLAFVFVYCGSDLTREPTFVDWARSLPAGFWHEVMTRIANHLLIFTNAGEGLAQQIKHNIRGADTYLLGAEYQRGVWFYFPLALSMKASVTMLTTPFAILFTRPRSLLNWPCVVAAALLLYSLTCRVQIGIRFMFPLFAFASVGLGAAFAAAFQSASAQARAGMLALLLAGFAMTAFEAFRIWPEEICYTNPFWGGTEGAYRLLSDSNYDWGQGLEDLRRWQRRHSPGIVDVWYFGTDPSVAIPPLRELPLHRIGASIEEAVKGRVVAVSATLLYGAYSQGAGSEAVSFFRARKPSDRTMTFFIFDFRSPIPPQ